MALDLTVSMPAHGLELIVPLTRLHCHDGIASHLAALLPRLRSRGVRIDLAVGFIDVRPESARTLNAIREACRAFRLDERLLVHGKTLGLRTLAGQTAAIREMVKRCETRRPVIHLQGRALGPACRLALRLGSRVIFTSHLSVGSRADGSRVLKRAKAWSTADRVIAISSALGSELQLVEGHPQRNIRRIFHGVDLSVFRAPAVTERVQGRARFGIGSNTFVISMVARIADVKRHDTLLDACRTLRRDGRTFRLLIAGDGDAAIVGRLREQLEDHELSGYATYLGHANARDVFWASDATALPSEREGFGIGICEAMACGVIPLRTPTEGATDQIRDGTDGFLFPIGDHTALAERLAWLMDRPAERAAMSAAAAEAAQMRFSADVMADKTLAVYRELAFGALPDPRTLIG